MADGIDIGDAVLTFTGSTTQLDQAFARVQAGAESTAQKVNTSAAEMSTALTGLGTYFGQVGDSAEAAGDQIAEGMEHGTASIREAKGEAALLGEAFGVHLPRHVRSFVAELPGVGEALSAAFSATAILFLVQALVEGTEKLSNWIAETFIFTEAMKEADAAQKALNKTFIDSAAAIATLNKQYAVMGLTRKQVLVEDTKDIQSKIEALEAQHRHQLDDAWMFERDGEREKGAAKRDEAAATAKQIEVLQDQERNNSKEFNIAQEKDDAEFAKRRQKIAENMYFAIAKAREAAGKIADASAADSTRFLDFQLESQLKVEEKTTSEKIELIKKVLTAYAQELQEEEKTLEGSTTRKAAELKRQVEQGRISQSSYVAQVKQLYAEELAAFTKLINQEESLLDKDDPKQLQKYKQLEDQKVRLTEQASAKIEEASKKSFDIQKAATDSFANAFASMVSQVSSGADSFSAAMQKMGEAVLQSIAQQAGAQGAKEMALALGLVFDDPSDSATHFASAAAWFALDGALSAVGGAIGGSGGGGSSSGAPRGTQPVSTSSTSQPIGSGPINQKNVQRFASGGLISGPTMAMMGDSFERSAGQSEAAIPLDNPRAVAKIVSALGGGGGNHIHVNVNGMISGDNLGKVMEKISKRVLKGQNNLHASNTLRITKRSP